MLKAVVAATNEPSRLNLALDSALLERKRAGNLRELKITSSSRDFCSNDYLGFARNSAIITLSSQIFEHHANRALGSTGSRLISGNCQLAIELEDYLAQFHAAESATIFSTGYMANIAILSSLPTRHDTIIYDQFSHASIKDGARLSQAKSFSFEHNNCDDLESKLKRSCLKNSLVFVVVEALYSMHGDFAPISNVATLCTKYGACLVIDEAHSNGIIGPGGQGLFQSLNLADNSTIRMHSFGKAIGSHGAAVLGSQKLKEFLVNFARPFIYTTALPPHSLASILAAYKNLQQAEELRRNLFNNIKLFNSALDLVNDALSPIIPIPIPGNEKVSAAAQQLQDAGFDVRAIKSPSVALGSERLRISLHSFNTQEEILALAAKIKELL